MTEFDITALLTEDCGRMSGSQFELGPEAGRITWRNCLAFAETHPLVNDANRDDLQRHFLSYGAWDRTEVEAWSDTELCAMVWQEGAARIREFQEHCGGDFATYVRKCEEGSVSGELTVLDVCDEHEDCKGCHALACACTGVTNSGPRQVWFYVGG